MNQKFSQDTYLYASNALFIEQMYKKFCCDPNSVSEDWRNFFKNNDASSPCPSWSSIKNTIILENPSIPKLGEQLQPPLRQDNSLQNHRLKAYGHLAAKLDPLGIDKAISIEQLGIDPHNPKLSIYTSYTGVEFENLIAEEEREWLYSRFETGQVQDIPKNEKLKILQDLIETEAFEQFIHKKFPGAKRFSVEGGETSVVALGTIIASSAQSGLDSSGVDSVVIGMAHRGRLNTLAKILRKPYEALFGEFMGIYSIPASAGLSGDVKYHMGYSNDIDIGGKLVHLSLAANPSHLEAINPVAAGSTRARQDLAGDTNRDKAMTILIHGDSAFCGQGIVAESLSMSPLDAFTVGGIFHVVINNQVGFTANPTDGHKASRYSTEFAKIIGAPIIHVNGDEVESVVKAARLLAEYRAKFKKDVVLEIICYRKYGHNEGDEPMYTQPMMYNIIKNKKHAGLIYQEKLLSEGLSDQQTYDKLASDFHANLQKAFEAAKTYKPASNDFKGIWSNYSRFLQDKDKEVVTGVDKTTLHNLLSQLTKFPEGFSLNSKLQKLFEARVASFASNKIDWSTAEQLSFATLLNEAYPIRLVGQDAGRGTFSHRHSVLHDQNTGARFIPLSQINKLARYEVYDSNLSEFGVLGFEVGYSMSNPRSLVIWEAQFGDFSNGAQIIFDQFLSSMETKWLKLSGIVLLLPHSYEGQGPEHSSSRLERYLQLCALDNMIVTYPTSPANIFHLLRRQQLRSTRKPLIIMSPKSIFRNNLATSSVEELTTGTCFKEVIPDDLNITNAKKVILCSGKIYYDLVSARQKNNKNDIAIIRIEQLYPFPLEQLNKELEKYSGSKVIWCQEEPVNMGAWHFIYSRFAPLIKGGLVECVSRNESASPATGYATVHAQEQEELINKALS
ncbi:MAG: 2-oxoglutarate dehydrogenase E1 component [Alphaproteobacteria bacterium]|nr:2-oxoglutarate dehydrogenase E1 component [Alphaproteobacteria bacterium]